MTVRELLTAKGSQEIIAMESDRTVEDAIGKMSEHSVSALLVTEGGRTVGIFTERDVVRSYLVMKKRPFDTIPLRDAMTRDIMVAEEEDDIDSIMSIMIEKSIRHLPVTDGERKIIGMLSIRDIVKSQVKELQAKIHYLKDYVSGMHGGLWV